MKYYKYYKIVRKENPLIGARYVLEYLKRLDVAGNLEKAFNDKKPYNENIIQYNTPIKGAF